MSEILKVTLIQSNLVWENAVQNRINFERKINAIIEKTDLIVLPEMFTTGFSMYPENVSETMQDDTVNWLKKIAKENNVAICGSLVIEENGNYYNRFLFVTPDGQIKEYNKRHLFTLAGEHHKYKAGEHNVMITYKGWKIKPLICYDLRFPVWSRNINNYDVLLYVANWPKQRIEAWDSLLKARSIENMCYTIGVNRVGIDPNNNEYSGSTSMYDFLGRKQTDIPLSKESSVTLELVKKDQDVIRKKLNFLSDRDSFSIE